jgi:hypothetical protein
MPVADMDPGRRLLRRVEAGAGEPAVVLEAGLNDGAAAWERVLPLLARTCAWSPTTGRVLVAAPPRQVW